MPNIPIDPAIQNQVDQYQWFQSFEVAPGVVSPGIFPIDAGKYLDNLDIPSGLHGLNTLDTGCMEGAMPFELEARGRYIFRYAYPGSR